MDSGSISVQQPLIWKLDQGEDGQTVKGRFRIAQFLNAQSDKLYFEARNRAVSIQDYTLDMKRVN